MESGLVRFIGSRVAATIIMGRVANLYVRDITLPSVPLHSLPTLSNTRLLRAVTLHTALTLHTIKYRVTMCCNTAHYRHTQNTYIGCINICICKGRVLYLSMEMLYHRRYGTTKGLPSLFASLRPGTRCVLERISQT